jgi:hypothetical protein
MFVLVSSRISFPFRADFYFSCCECTTHLRFRYRDEDDAKELVRFSLAQSGALTKLTRRLLIQHSANM